MKNFMDEYKKDIKTEKVEYGVIYPDETVEWADSEGILEGNDIRTVSGQGRFIESRKYRARQFHISDIGEVAFVQRVIITFYLKVSEFTPVG